VLNFRFTNNEEMKERSSEMKKTKRTLVISAIIAIILIILDQITKYLAVLSLKGQAAFPIIKDVFELQYLENQSAAFGMDPVSLLHKIFSFQIFNENPQLFLQVKMIFFVILTVVLVVAFIWVFARIPQKKRFRFLDIILILFVSGAIGNFIDRVTHQYVIDFFYFKLINFPIFNVADIYVTVAAFAMVVVILFYYKEEDFEEIFPKKIKEKA